MHARRLNITVEEEIDIMSLLFDNKNVLIRKKYHNLLVVRAIIKTIFLLGWNCR